MRWTQDLRQACWLIVGVWTLSCLLFAIPVWATEGALTLRFATHLGSVGLAGILYSGLVFAAARWSRGRRALLRAATLIAAVVIAAILLAATYGALTWAMGMAPDPGDMNGLVGAALGNAVGFAWLYGLLAAVFAVVEANAVTRERERQLAESRAAEAEARALAADAKAAAGAARLTALNYQLSPHLLFNALNAASSLVINRRNEEAEVMLAKLADFLRSTLLADPQGTVRLVRELSTLETYLDVEAVRFGERLRVVVDCPAELEDALVPSFILQPLVENAVKYAVTPTINTITLHIAAAREGDRLIVRVEDDGDPVKAGAVRKGTGLGLANVRQRLELLHGDRGTLETEPLARGFRATIRLPLTWAEAGSTGAA